MLDEHLDYINTSDDDDDSYIMTDEEWDENIRMRENDTSEYTPYKLLPNNTTFAEDYETYLMHENDSDIIYQLANRPRPEIDLYYYNTQRQFDEYYDETYNERHKDRTEYYIAENANYNNRFWIHKKEILDSMYNIQYETDEGYIFINLEKIDSRTKTFYAIRIDYKVQVYFCELAASHDPTHKCNEIYNQFNRYAANSSCGFEDNYHEWCQIKYDKTPTYILNKVMQIVIEPPPRPPQINKTDEKHLLFNVRAIYAMTLQYIHKMNEHKKFDEYVMEIEYSEIERFMSEIQWTSKMIYTKINKIFCQEIMEHISEFI